MSNQLDKFIHTQKIWFFSVLSPIFWKKIIISTFLIRKKWLICWFETLHWTLQIMKKISEKLPKFGQKWQKLTGFWTHLRGLDEQVLDSQSWPKVPFWKALSLCFQAQKVIFCQYIQHSQKYLKLKLKHKGRKTFFKMVIANIRAMYHCPRGPQSSHIKFQVAMWPNHGAKGVQS